ncbi:hypothetical protein [Bacillus sp. V59.32b]|uniref:hypothetical protein n=1 Tax=Bacillus sp. V59.32b TaxID=1758642 RepID=UPI000E3E909C|nr:hypothetical protein [Bacillus sp. V59.32b]RFU68530.1 hypothetical protein D0463_04470 [Bacillus sp. V59.32b]
MSKRDKHANGDQSGTNPGSHTENDAVDVSSLSSNSKQNPEIRSGGRGPVIINDPEATELNRGIFDNTHREYYDGDQYR